MPSRRSGTGFSGDERTLDLHIDDQRCLASLGKEAAQPLALARLHLAFLKNTAAPKAGDDWSAATLAAHFKKETQFQLDLANHGGGATHGSAYALYHNRQMARLAKLLGNDG